MVRASQRSCLSFLALFALSFCPLCLVAGLAHAQGKPKVLPKSVQEKIQKALDQSGNEVMVFNGAGDKTGSASVSKSTAETYESLSDFAKSGNSPAKTCKDPVPTPPPPCIICSSGQVVCSKASFASKQSRPRSAQPEVKPPASEKPQ